MSPRFDKLERSLPQDASFLDGGQGALPEDGVLVAPIDAVSAARRLDDFLAWRASSTGRRLILVGGTLEDRLAAIARGADDAIAEGEGLEERIAVQRAILGRGAAPAPTAGEIDQLGVGRWSLGRADLPNFSGDWPALIGEQPSEELCSASQDVTERWWAEHQHPHDMLPLFRAWERACRGEMPCLDVIFRLRHRAGHWVWVRSVSEVFVARDGALVEARGVVRRADAATAEREESRVTSELLTHLSSSIPGALFRVEAHDVSLPRLPELVFVDDGLKRLLGVESSPAPPWGPVLRRFVHPDDLERVLTGVKAIYQERRDWREVFRVIDSRGKTRTLRGEATYEPRDGRAPVDAWNGVLVDISEQVESERRFQTLFESELEGIVIQRIGGAILELNATARHQLGDVTGAALEDVLAAELPDLAARMNAICRDPDEDGLAEIGSSDERAAPIVFRRGVEEQERELELQLRRLDAEIVVARLRDVTAERARRDELNRARSLMEMTQSLARVGGIQYEIEADRIFWTPEAYKLREVPEDFTPTLENSYGFYEEETRDRMRERVEELLRSGGTFTIEGWMRTWTGRRIAVRSRGFAELRDGKPVRVIGVFMDIDAEVQAREVLTATIRRHTAIERLGLVGGIELLREGCAVWTDEARRLLGLRSPLATGLTPLLDALEEADRERLRRKFGALCARGEPFRVVVELKGEELEEPRSLRVSGDRSAVEEEGRCLLVLQDITGQRRAEQAVIKGEARLREMLDSIPAVIYRRYTKLDGTMVIDYASKHVEVVTGRPPEFFRGDVSILRQVIHEDDLQSYISQDHSKPFLVEYRIRRPDGSVIFVRNQARPTEPAEGELAAWTGLILDITAERTALMELRNSERRFRELFENARDGLVLSNPDLEILAVNPRACELLERDVAELVGRFAWQIAGPGREEALRQAEATLKTGLNVGELRLQTADGAERVLEYRSSLVGPDRLLTSLIDITERKHRELELSRNKALLARTESLSRTGGWELDLLSGELRFTDQTYHIYELPIGEPPKVDEGLSYYDGAGREQLREAFEQLVKEGRRYDLKLPFTTARGRSLWVRAVGDPELVDGRVVRLWGTLQDITEQVRTEDQLRRQNRLRDSLIEFASEGICVLSTDAVSGQTEFLIWNERMTEITGFTREEMEREGWADTLYANPDDLAEYRARTQRLARGEELRREEVHVTHKSGEPLILEMSTARIAPESGPDSAEYYVTLVNDLTERRELERRLIAASTHEQQRIGHDLHDTISQQLVGLSLFTRAFVSGLGADHPRVAEKGQHLLESLKSITASVRSISSMLSPLQDGSFETALEGLARSITVGFGVTCRASCTGDAEGLEPSVAAELYRIAQEAATNAAKHSRGLLIRIEYGVTLAGPYLFVFDDGIGFEHSSGHDRRGMGLRIMEYRARSIGWTIEWRSQRPGTLVVCRPRRKLTGKRPSSRSLVRPQLDEDESPSAD